MAVVFLTDWLGFRRCFDCLLVDSIPTILGTLSYCRIDHLPRSAHLQE